MNTSSTFSTVLTLDKYEFLSERDSCLRESRFVFKARLAFLMALDLLDRFIFLSSLFNAATFFLAWILAAAFSCLIRLFSAIAIFRSLLVLAFLIFFSISSDSSVYRC